MITKSMGAIPTAAAVLLGLAAVPLAADLNDVVRVLPKFAIPMREVSDRYQNMYFAAKGFQNATFSPPCFIWILGPQPLMSIMLKVRGRERTARPAVRRSGPCEYSAGVTSCGSA